MQDLQDTQDTQDTRPQNSNLQSEKCFAFKLNSWSNSNMTENYVCEYDISTLLSYNK